MCDTLVVTPDASATGTLLFAKNSDRERNEAHQIVALPAARHAAGSRLDCTWIGIPQIRETRAVLLAKPHWIWGAEMGANDAGVVIGNEALFTRAAPGPDGLLGMDLVRLGLERAGNATQALDVMIDLLERHGQGGLCAVQRDFRYDNGFIVADPSQAWILETVGRQWVTRRVDGCAAISNLPSTGTDFEAASAGAFDEPRRRAWLQRNDPDDFAAAWTDPEPTARSNGQGRCRRAEALMQSASAPLAPTDLLRILRDHGAAPGWRPDDLSRPSTLCMHAALTDWRPSQTTGAMLSVVDPVRATHFLTGTAAPCLSPFRPSWIDATASGFEPWPTARADSNSSFWRHERMHRAALGRHLPDVLALIGAERDAGDAARIAAALAVSHSSRASRQAHADEAFAEAERTCRGWHQRILEMPPAADLDPAWSAAWAKQDRLCGLVS